MVTVVSTGAEQSCRTPSAQLGSSFLGQERRVAGRDRKRDTDKAALELPALTHPSPGHILSQLCSDWCHSHPEIRHRGSIYTTGVGKDGISSVRR